MAALVKSIENFTTTFNPSGSGLSNNVVNLTQGQDETNCFAFATLRHTNASTNDNRSANAVGVEFFDNSGTPAARVYWNVGSDTTPGDLLADVFVVEAGANLTVEQDTISLTGTSATATISTVTQTKACIVHTKAAIGTATSDDFNDLMLQMRFNSDTQIQCERRAAGAPDWTVYAYTLSSDEWDTEYAEINLSTSSDTTVTHTLSNSVTLANSFLVCTYETAESSDDLRDAGWNAALTSTTQITCYRDSGGSPSAFATFGIWAVRASSAELATQRFATECDGQLTTNQTITTVDTDKAVIIDSGNVGGHGFPTTSTISGDNAMDRQHTIRLTSTTNVQLQRQADVTIDGSPNNVRYEVVEFELETGGGDVTLVVDAGSYTWTGQPIDTTITMPAGSGSYTWTGQAIDTTITMPADAGSYTWTGQAVDFALNMPADLGSYVWSGQDADLRKSFNLSVDAGSYSWAGQDAQLLIDQVLEANSGSYAWSGQDATLRVDEILEANSGSYAWTGQDAGLIVSKRIVAESGSYVWAGQDATLRTNEILVADPGSYAWTGQNANLISEGALVAESGSYLWAGQDATLIPPTPSVTGANTNIGFINDVGRFMN